MLLMVAVAVTEYSPMLAHQTIRPAPHHVFLPDPDLSASVFESLVCETHTAALLTAAIASVANTLKTLTTARSEAELAPYVPHDPTVVIAFRRWASEAGIGVPAMSALASYFADLEPARRQTGRYFADANVIGPDRAVALHQFALTGVWRGVCRSAVSAVKHLNTEIDDRLPELYTLNAGVLVRLLEAAAQGESPCVDGRGQLYLPALPQRRQTSRRTVGQAAMVTIAGTKFRAYVRDVSAGGFGLEQLPVVEVGQTAVIETMTGRRFTGSIAWYKKGRAGVRFMRPLTPNDPLMWG